jgi:hypothetical protein
VLKSTKIFLNLKKFPERAKDIGEKVKLKNNTNKTQV